MNETKAAPIDLSKPVECVTPGVEAMGLFWHLSTIHGWLVMDGGSAACTWAPDGRCAYCSNGELEKAGIRNAPEVVTHWANDYAQHQAVTIMLGNAAGGMSLRDFFIAHAPAEPQPWFEPKVPPRPEGEKPSTASSVLLGLPPSAWEIERAKQRYIQWPAAWADAMLAERERVKP